MRRAMRWGVLALVVPFACGRPRDEPQPPAVNRADLERARVAPPAAQAEAESAEAQAVAEAAPTVPREPKPAPIFAGHSEVSVQALLEQLELVAVAMEASPVVRKDYLAFVAEQNLEDAAELYRDYVRVKLAFETTRDGGLWQSRWRITNRKPNSEQIWAQWSKVAALDEGDKLVATAEAECDELSALFAFVVRRLGVDKVGLFWPEWNHVVAVWTIPQGDKIHRIVVPTSQIFLEPDASLGTRGFNPWRQKTIYTYKRKDVPLQKSVPVAVARFFVRQAQRYGARSQAELQRLRNERSRVLDGS